MTSKKPLRGVALITAFSLWHGASVFAASPTGQSFTSPREAVIALEKAAAAKNLAELQKIFGPGYSEIANPDLVQATNEVTAFAAALREHNRLVPAGEKRMLIEFGRDNTEFPVPLTENSGRWTFDTKAGTEELINRRIGRNELDVLETVRTYVQAQREYASRDRDEDEVLEYAQRFLSAPEERDGLFWPPTLDGTLSPLGPLMAEAEAAGYRHRAAGERQPFHGYYFKILTQQGRHAPGGAYNYVINKNMIGGFAVVAWPAEYRVTGVMTFVVNQQGRVFQKDLGDRTTRLASGMKEYNPDQTWTVSRD